MSKYSIFILFLFLISCGDPELPEASLAVEGYLFAGEPIDHVKLSLVKPINATGEQVPVSDAEVFIGWNGKNYQLKEVASTPGTFAFQNVDFKVIPDELYTLYIQYHNNEYEAHTVAPSVPIQLTASKDTLDSANPNDQINITWQNTDSTSYLGVIAPEIPSSTEFPFNNFFSLPTRSNSIKISTKDVHSTGSQHFVLYGITEEYAKLYRISSSSIGASNVGNISNGFGIFAAFSSDTLTFVVK